MFPRLYKTRHYYWSHITTHPLYFIFCLIFAKIGKWDDIIIDGYLLVLIWTSVEGRPAEHKILGNAQTISCLVDDPADVDGSGNDFSAVLGAVSFDFVPGGFGGHFNSLLELLWGIDVGVINPFLILDVVVVGPD